MVILVVTNDEDNNNGDNNSDDRCNNNENNNDNVNSEIRVRTIMFLTVLPQLYQQDIHQTIHYIRKIIILAYHILS